MNSANIIWSEAKQQRLFKAITGYWQANIWNLAQCPDSEPGKVRWSRFFGQQCCLEYKRHDYEKGIIKIKAESGTTDSSPAQI
jgi:hypothetical protein